MAPQFLQRVSEVCLRIDIVRLPPERVVEGFQRGVQLAHEHQGSGEMEVRVRIVRRQFQRRAERRYGICVFALILQDGAE